MFSNLSALMPDTTKLVRLGTRSRQAMKRLAFLIIGAAFAYWLSLHGSRFLAQLRKPHTHDILLNNVYAVITSDLNLYYLVHLPFIVMHWKNFGVKSLANEELDNAAKSVIVTCEEMGAHVLYVHNKTIDAGQFSQTVRNFAAATSFAHTLDPDQTIFVTTDVDFYPLNIRSHVPNLSCGKEIMFYDYDCCGKVNWKREKYDMYIMITIAMTLRRWREVIELPQDRPLNSSEMDEIIQSTFDHSVNKQKIFWRWFLDQRFFGLKYHKWKKRNLRTFNRIVEIFDRRSMPRLERKWWPDKSTLDKTKLNDWESIHMTPGIFMDNVWDMNLPIYKKLYDSEQLRFLTSYRESVIKVMNSSATVSRHYHPEQNDDYWRNSFGQKGMVKT